MPEPTLNAMKNEPENDEGTAKADAGRVGLTNHGAELDSKPLCERWRRTPVLIREDIAQHGQQVKFAADLNDLTALDLLAYAMEHLALQSASFGGFGDQGAKLDELVKLSVGSHHRTWVMRPLEKLYDKLKTGAPASGEEAEA